MLGIFATDGSGLNPREWNALIGIITAIVGNTLISFALNIQRYAHIRLGKDRQERRRLRQNRKRRKKGIPTLANYGSQLEVAEERALLNRKAPEMDEEDDEHQARYHVDGGVDGGMDDRGDEEGRGGNDENGVHDMADERTPLNRSSTLRSSSSSSTVRPAREEKKDGEEPTRKKSYLRSPYWWLGMVLMTTGEAGNFIAYGFAPASIVSPLGVVALISNCIIAPLLLKETFRQRDFWGVLIAIGGAVTVVLSARMTDPKLGPKDIWEAITRWEFELYMGLTVAAMIVLAWASSRYGHKSAFIDLGLAGLFGGYTALSTKGIASLLTDTIWRAITFPIFYVLLVVLVLTAVLQIRYVNQALQRFDSTRVVPTQFVCFTISVIVGSAVLYREFESTTAKMAGKFIGGCIMTFLGVYLIQSGKRDQGGLEEDDEESGELGGISLVDDEQGDGDRGDADGQTNTNSRSYRSSVVSTTAVDADATPRLTQMSETPTPAFDNGPKTPTRTRSAASAASGTYSFGSGVSPFSDAPWPDNATATTTTGASKQTLQPSTSASTSEPALASPNDAQPTWPTTPSQRRPPNSTVPTPNGTGSASSISRKSMSRLLQPGPISSPLSSSLSAIVADQLRRGVDVTGSPRAALANAPGSSKRTSLRKMRSNILDAESNEVLLEGEEGGASGGGRQYSRSGLSRQTTRDTTGGDLPTPGEAEELLAEQGMGQGQDEGGAEGSGGGQSRRRSASKTLTDLFKRPSRQESQSEG